jgi:hypothetical protein
MVSYYNVTYFGYIRLKPFDFVITELIIIVDRLKIENFKPVAVISLIVQLFNSHLKKANEFLHIFIKFNTLWRAVTQLVLQVNHTL